MLSYGTATSDTIFDGCTGNIDNCYGVITVSNSIIVMLTSYDTVYVLYFDTVFDDLTGTNEATTADKITNIFWLQQLKLISYIPCTVSNILQAIIACTVHSENNMEPSSRLSNILQTLLYNIQAYSSSLHCHNSPSFNTNNNCVGDTNGSFGRVAKTTPLHIINTDTSEVLRPVYQQAIVATILSKRLKPPVDNDSPVTVTRTTQVYSSLASPSYDIDTESSGISVDDGLASVITKTTTSFIIIDSATSSYDLSNNNRPSKLLFDTTSSAVQTIVITTALYELPSAIHDEISSTVSNGKFVVVESKLLSDDTTSSTVRAFVATIFITLINTPFHFIDHGSVVYLVHLQIRFYDQQDSLSLLENNSTSLENNNGECDMNNTDEMTRCVMKVISSAAIADGAQYDYYYGDAAVSIASSSIVAVSIASPSIAIDTESSTVPAANIKAYPANNNSTVTAIMTTQVYSSPSSLPFESSNNYVTLFSAVADISYESLSAAIMKTTAPCTLHSMQRNTSVLYDRNSSAVTIMTTAAKMMTNDINNAVYFAVIDVESYADITNTFTSYVLPSDDNDTESSTVSVADEATSAFSCHSSNNFSLISSCQFDQTTLFLLTLLLFYRTLYLIITYLLLLISNQYFDTISC